MGLFLARKTPKLLYNVTTGVFLVTTSLVVTLLWHCSDIFSLQVDFSAILCCHSLKNQRVSPCSHYKTCSIFVVEFFAYIERNLLEVIIKRLVVTFSRNLDENFSWQEVPTTWNRDAVIKGSGPLHWTCWILVAELKQVGIVGILALWRVYEKLDWVARGWCCNE